jgi:hypothetical protein
VTTRRGFAFLWRARSRSGAVTWRLTELDSAGRIDGQGDGPVFARRSATALGAALVPAGSGVTGLWHVSSLGAVTSADAP